jgi:hypothetical protein
MKLPQFSSFLPALGAVVLMAAPATSFADHKVTIYRDRDGDGHFNKKSFDVSRNRVYRGGNCYPYARPYYGYRPYYYGYQPYYYGYGPSVSFSVNRTYYSQPDYSDDLAVDVQSALRRRGFYRGAVDGDVGPGTRQAIRSYQYSRGLTVTGRIDRPLLRSLGIV